VGGFLGTAAARMAARMAAILRNGLGSSAGASCAMLAPTVTAPILSCISSGASLDALLSPWLTVSPHRSSLGAILRTAEAGNESSRADVSGGELRRVLESVWAADSPECSARWMPPTVPAVSPVGGADCWGVPILKQALFSRLPSVRRD
jgi:hypothetical protein